MVSKGGGGRLKRSLGAEGLFNHRTRLFMVNRRVQTQWRNSQDEKGREDEDEEKAAASTMEIKGEGRSSGEMTRAKQPCKTLGFL